MVPQMTPQLASARSVAAMASAILLKSGYDPSQPRDDHGRWDESGSGGGHTGGPTTGHETRGFPYGPSRREREMESAHKDLIMERNAMRRGGVPERDPDMMDLDQKIAQSSAALAAKQAERHAALELERRRATQNSAHPRPGAADAAAESARAAQERRRLEAERLQAWRRSSQSTSSASTGGEADLLRQIDNLGATASAAASAAASVGSGGFRSALADTTARLARSVRQVHNILGHAHGISTTTDYSQIGQHLNFIRDDIGALQRELKSLPASARDLRTETAIKLRAARTKADELQQKLKAKLRAMRSKGQ